MSADASSSVHLETFLRRLHNTAPDPATKVRTRLFRVSAWYLVPMEGFRKEPEELHCTVDVKP
jgi:hypothetical protein